MLGIAGINVSSYYADKVRGGSHGQGDFTKKVFVGNLSR